MRIGNNIRTGKIAARGSVSGTAGGTSFRIDEGAPGGRPVSATAAAGPATEIGSLLALQAVEDPLLKRKKLLRRGRDLLDVLEELKADLLVGAVDAGRLSRLIALISQARERSEPELDAVLDDIELRAQVELAKHGVFGRR